MDAQYSTIRNLLWIVMVLAVLAVASNFYVASRLDRNSDELASIYQLLQKDLMGKALTQSEELQKRMDSLNASANGVDTKMKQAEDEMDAKLKQAQAEMDARLKKAQDDFVARMKVELPKIMDNYAASRAPMLQREAEKKLKKSGVPMP
jgi:biopolymer transport protein ExbB/TolQ